MAIVAYPFDSQNITEADYGALIGAGLQTGVVGTPASNHFKVVAGTGMQLVVTAVGGASLALLRGHACAMTANEPVTVAASDAGARKDLVVLRLDYASNTIAPAVKKGTSGSSVVPTPTWGAGGVYEMPLAVVDVAGGASSISNGNITDARQFAGATVGAWPTTGRPTGRPALGYNLTDSVWEATVDGTNWLRISTTNHTLDSHEGILGLAKGGTGASTALTARANLEIIAQASAPAHQAGRIWVKLPS